MNVFCLVVPLNRCRKKIQERRDDILRYVWHAGTHCLFPLTKFSV